MKFDTGEVAWRDRSVGKGSLVFADDRLYLYSEGGVVGLAEANPGGLSGARPFPASRPEACPTWSHPVVSGGKLFLRDQDTIYAYDVRGEVAPRCQSRCSSLVTRKAVRRRLTSGERRITNHGQ